MISKHIFVDNIFKTSQSSFFFCTQLNGFILGAYWELFRNVLPSLPISGH